MPRTTTARPIAVLLLAAGLLAGCGDGADPEAAPGTPASSAAAEPAEPLRILLVNDDGVVNPAIDVMLGLLSEEDDVDITVVAPAEERSGSSDRTTGGPVPYREATTPGGAEAWAVDGFPADAVLVGLDELDLDPHLVLSGVNPGQNIGPFTALSGTVGVGRTAIRQGVPALAVSAGLELDEAQFTFAAELARDWIREHRDALLDGSAQTATVTSINVPACPVPAMGELQEVVRADAFPPGADPFASTCDLSGGGPVTDHDALRVGYPSITQVPADI